MKILIKEFKKALTELKLFYFTSFIVALLVIIPISNFLLEGVQYVVSGNFSLGIAGGEEILETLKVLVLTSFFGGGLGTLNGWLLSNCDFKFRKVLRICQLIPLAAPAYLITAVLQDLGSIFGYQVTGLWWGVLILSISTYPYVFILANESFNKFGVNQINASRGLGVGPWSSFFKIAFPMALPALITGISLMCMEVMNELGTFALLNIPSISTGIAENWIIEGNPKNAIGLSLVPVILYSGSLSLVDIVSSQSGNLSTTIPILSSIVSFIPKWNIFPQFIAFGIFFIAAVAEVNRAPFDLVEAEQELVGGFHTEYSGFRFAMFFLAEYINMFNMCAITATFFLGGWLGPTFAGVLPPFLSAIMPTIWLGVKTFGLLFVYFWIRATLPRLRYDQLMELGWKRLIPLSLIWLMISSIVLGIREFGLRWS